MLHGAQYELNNVLDNSMIEGEDAPVHRCNAALLFRGVIGSHRINCHASRAWRFIQQELETWIHSATARSRRSSNVFIRKRRRPMRRWRKSTRARRPAKKR